MRLSFLRPHRRDDDVKTKSSVFEGIEDAASFDLHSRPD